ncbi:MAG: DUF1189 domain-containing protein, partial [Legionellales bacterium]|nr:DUF1189 domain-containing protein [Legionellales bacterium]
LLTWIRPLWQSFYSPTLYRQAAQQWSGIALTYILLLAVVIGVPSYWFVAGEINRLYAKFIVPSVAQFPTVTIEQGQVHIDRPLPYAIKLPGQKQPYLLFLEDDQLAEDERLPANIVVTKRVIYSRHTPNQSPIVYPLPEDMQRLVTRQQMESILATIKKVVLYTMLLMIITAVFIFIGLLVGFNSVIATVVIKLMGIQLTYWQLVRLAVVGLIPPMFTGVVLEMLQRAFNLFHYDLLLVMVMAVAYYLFAIYCNKQINTVVSAD